MKKSLLAILILTGTAVFAGCGQTTYTESEWDEQYYEEEYPEEYVDEEYYGEAEEYEAYDEASEFDYGSSESDDGQAQGAEGQSEDSGASGDAQGESTAVGIWYTDGYDQENEWATSYKIELTADGKASCTGWRNQDTGTYKMTGDNKALITFDHCEISAPGEGIKPVDDFIYTIEMTINGNDAEIKIDAPDVISNIEDGTVHRESDNGTSGSSGTSKGDDASGSNDKGKASDIADGEYITDEKYTGEISGDGSTLTIETALYHYDKDWNTVLDYEKSTYVFPTSGSCKCVVFTETKEENPVAERVDFINEFLKGNSGLPITLKIKNNQLTEIGFTS
ncbi:MAG: hypothetical protein K6G42_04210 [Lachnospiraceae bacterium]|nr:hypothetical protein [Lachnospiraceae bacterium]